MKIIIISIILAISLCSCHFGKMIYYGAADTNDYKKFPQIELHKSERPFFFATKQNIDINTIPLPSEIEKDKNISNFETFFNKRQTTSLLIIKNDTIIYEQYFQNFNDSAIFTSFSVNKSFISALIGIAIDEGKITSKKDPITKYLTNFRHKGFEKITIENLLDMESGIKFRENYFNPMAEVGLYYYGKNLRKYVKNLKIKEPSGKNYEYISVNTLLLAIILENAIGINVDEYYQTKLWSPLEMEFDATLNIDSKKHRTIKSYCCLNARTRDYAKFGRLYLNNGIWNGKQIVSKEWVEDTKSATTKIGDDIYYKNQWRVDSEGNFWAKGFLSQYIFVNPKTKVIIVITSNKSEKGEFSPILKYISNLV